MINPVKAFFDVGIENISLNLSPFVEDQSGQNP